MSRSRQAGRLGLDGDHRHVVRDDVVQLAGDARPLLHQRLVALRLVALGDRLAALPARVPDRERGDDHHE